MTGWCENCGAVEVKPMCVSSNSNRLNDTPVPEHGSALPGCCPYAECPFCGDDVDQWAAS